MLTPGYRSRAAQAFVFGLRVVVGDLVAAEHGVVQPPQSHRVVLGEQPVGVLDQFFRLV